MATKEKYYGEARMKDSPSKGDVFKLKDNVIGNNHIKNEAITSDKFSSEVENVWLNPIINAKYNEVMVQVNELRQLIMSYVEHGVALSNDFGDSEEIGITQKKLTEEFDRVWEKIHELEVPEDGIRVKIDPNPVVSEGAGTTNISIISRAEQFDRVQIYVNDTLVIDRSNTQGFSEDITISQTSIVKTVVRIMDKEYTDIKTVDKVFPFIIGSGTIWKDAVKTENAREYDGHLTGSYDITVNKNGEKMFVIIPSRLRNQMTRIDMNGFEVPVIIKEHEDLTIFESQNDYLAGRYNLDIT